MSDEVEVRASKKKQPKIKPAQWALKVRNRVSAVLAGLGYLATVKFAKKVAIRTAWIVFTLVLVRDFVVLLIQTISPSTLQGTDLFILEKVFSFITGGGS